MRFRCPDWTGGPAASDLLGCGWTFDSEPDFEGLMDCPQCGIWFRADEPGVMVEEQKEESR